MAKYYSRALFHSDVLRITFYNMLTRSKKKTEFLDIQDNNKYLIFYCISDGFSCQIKDEYTTLKKGNIIILRPNENIKFYSNAAFNTVESDILVAKTPMDLVMIELNDKMFENDIDTKGFFRIFNERERYKYNIYFEDPLKNAFFHNCAMLFGNYISNNLDVFQFKSLISIIITQLNLKFDKYHSYSPVKYSREYELKIYDYISRNFNKDISIKSLSQEFFVSKVYINKVTNRFYGTNFNDMITSKRMWEAIDLMKKGVDLTKISSFCGYKNYSSFYRNFVDFFGDTPKEKQKQINKLIKQRDYVKLKELTNKKTGSI